MRNIAGLLYFYMVDPLSAILSVTGIVVSVVLIVLFRRNRNQDQLTRRRFLLLSVLTPVHTLLFPLAYLTYENNWTFLIIWFTLIPILFFTNIFYFVQLYKYKWKWKNLGLLFATLAFGIYNAYLFLLTLFWVFSASSSVSSTRPPSDRRSRRFFSA